MPNLVQKTIVDIVSCENVMWTWPKSDLVEVYALILAVVLAIVMFIMSIILVKKEMQRTYGRKRQMPQSWTKRRKTNDLPSPRFEFVNRKTKVNWKNKRQKEQANYSIYGPLRLRKVKLRSIHMHMLLTFGITIASKNVLAISWLFFYLCVYALIRGWFWINVKWRPCLNAKFEDLTMDIELIGGSRKTVRRVYIFLLVLLFGVGGLSNSIGILDILNSHGWTPVLLPLPLLTYFLVARKTRKSLITEVDVDRRNLLILRVFGSTWRSGFLFSKLQVLWRRIGSIYTIGSPDQSLWSIRWILPMSFFQSILLLPPLLLFSTAASFWNLDLRNASVAAPSIAGTVVLCIIVFYLPLRLYIRRTFTNQREMDEQLFIDMMQGCAGQYDSLTFYCHGDDWQKGVAKLAKFAAGVVMDMRGFSEKNKGSEYELGFLINKFPIECVLLLVDRSTDLTQLKASINEAWQYMASNSPNYKHKVTKVRIYKRWRLSGKDVYSIAANIFNHAPTKKACAGA